MIKFRCSKKCSAWIPIVILLYFVINFRVEAGIATLFERTLDGLVGGVVLLYLLYISARFFNILNPADKKDPLSFSDNSKENE